MKYNERFLSEIREEIHRLETMIANAKRRLEGAPEGCVRIKKHKSCVQYYHRIDKKDTSGTYIPAAERNRAIALALRETV